MKSSSHEGGAVLVFAVLLLAAGVFVLTGIAQLAATQAVIGRNEWDALQRRVTLENSRAMARQFVLARMFSNVVSTTPAGYTNNDTPTLGGFVISNTGGAPAGLYWNAASAASGQVINPFNPMERGGFYPGSARAELLSDTTGTGPGSVGWDFVVRTRSPIAAGYSFVQQRPESRDFSGASRYVDATVFAGFADIPQIPVSSVTNTNVSVDESTGYRGFFAVPPGPAVPLRFESTNPLQPVGDPANPAGLKATVNLAQDQASAGAEALAGLAYEYEVPAAADYTNATGTVYPQMPVTRLEVQGTEAGDSLPPLQIMATNNAALTNVVLTGNNPAQEGRRVYLHYRGSGGTPLSLTASNVAVSGWRLAVSVRGSEVDLDGLFSEGINLAGGIRTDGSVSPGVDAPVGREENPQGLDYIADQMMWLEDYRAP